MMWQTSFKHSFSFCSQSMILLTYPFTSIPPGGVVSAGLGIYDTMNLVKPKVNTICTGMAASMASVLFCAGHERSILPHAKVMIHQPLGGAQGQASDILIAAKEIEKCRKELCSIISRHTKQSYDKVFGDMDRDFWLDAQEAVEYGLVDRVMTGEN